MESILVFLLNLNSVAHSSDIYIKRRRVDFVEIKVFNAGDNLSSLLLLVNLIRVNKLTSESMMIELSKDEN